MTFTWDDKTVGWMLEAAEYTGFYRNMAALLLPHIQKRGTLCDFGCGMALTDMALAPALEAVTCVDQSAPVLAFAQTEARRRGIDNLSCLCANGPEVTGHWDTVMATVQETGREDYPYYTPKTRSFTLFDIPAAENRGRL